MIRRHRRSPLFPTPPLFRPPMAAGVATLKLVAESDYLERTQRLGAQLREGLDEAAARHGFGLRQTGPAQLPLILFEEDRKSTRLNSSHSQISYAVFCLKKKT